MGRAENDTYAGLRKFLAPEVVSGRGSRLLAVDYCRNLQLERVLVVSDPGVIAAGWAAEIVDALGQAGMETALFSDITENPKDHEVEAGAQRYRRAHCRGIVAVGGGSVLDCAKGIGIVVSNGERIGAFEGVDKVAAPMPPLICIPTTAGSSADVSQFAIITDTSRRLKFAVISKALVPDVAMVDPVPLTTMGSELSTATGMDALSHAFEAYASNGSSFLTDKFALESVELVAANLSRSVHTPDDLEARTGMMRASLLAGFAFSNASLGAVHALAHAIGGLTDIPHGVCNAVLLKQVVRANFSAAPERYRTLCTLLRAGLGLSPPAPDNTVEALSEAVEHLAAECGLDLSLVRRGLAPELVPRIAANAFQDPCLLTNPRRLSIAELEEILYRVG